MRSNAAQQLTAFGVWSIHVRSVKTAFLCFSAI